MFKDRKSKHQVWSWLGMKLCWMKLGRRKKTIKQKLETRRRIGSDKSEIRSSESNGTRMVRSNGNEFHLAQNLVVFFYSSRDFKNGIGKRVGNELLNRLDYAFPNAFDLGVSDV
jgi:hypothetical protein